MNFLCFLPYTCEGCPRKNPSLADTTSLAPIGHFSTAATSQCSPSGNRVPNNSIHWHSRLQPDASTSRKCPNEIRPLERSTKSSGSSKVYPGRLPAIETQRLWESYGSNVPNPTVCRPMAGRPSSSPLDTVRGIPSPTEGLGVSESYPTRGLCVASDVPNPTPRLNCATQSTKGRYRSPLDSFYNRVAV